MRIAIVSDFYLDYVGGLQTSMLEQRAALQRAGHTVLLISLARHADGDVPGVGLQLRPSYTVPGVVLPVRGAGRQLVALLRRYLTANAIDVVHLQTEFGLAHAATTAANELGIPVIHTVHTFYWQSTGIGPVLATPVMRYGLEIVFRRRIPRHPFARRAPDALLRNVTFGMARRADRVVSPSAHQADDLRRAGVTVPIAVIPNPIAAGEHPPILLDSNRAAHPRVLWVGRCEAEKRPLVFAEAVLLARRRADFEVDLVGSGAQLPAVRRLLRGQAGIRIHGGLPHDAVIELMDAASIVALTSYGFDNQPMTIAEASSRFRGVLYCDPRLSEGLARSGTLARSPDAPGLADALVEVVTSPARLLELSAGAERDSLTFSAATYAERIVAVYDSALSSALISPDRSRPRPRR